MTKSRMMLADRMAVSYQHVGEEFSHKFITSLHRTADGRGCRKQVRHPCPHGIPYMITAQLRCLEPDSIVIDGLGMAAAEEHFADDEEYLLTLKLYYKHLRELTLEHHSNRLDIKIRQIERKTK